jgi:hypothetical protein
MGSENYGNSYPDKDIDEAQNRYDTDHSQRKESELGRKARRDISEQL